ncbi:DUF2239 family protein [Thiothrix lacustris]|uniref:DUF2239 family protein n=1 Tax=Thiothrix lacustris TaxID=525917 RepID=UPI0027E5990D|nr:DUF2239 family protein [Thiothrix lacustris]WMP16895.1 DUF2239 family protein [Thiothrix lacustris]
MSHAPIRWIAFAQTRCLVTGTSAEVTTAVKTFVDENPESTVLAFDAVTSYPVEIDLRGSLAEVLARLPPAATEDVTPEPRSVGRPKLGVVPKEVTLLPRHWEWLANQPGSTSVVLRKLVEQAMRANGDTDRVRQSREATYRFIQALAGNEAGYEEASRALFAGDIAAFREHTSTWGQDIREHALGLASIGAADKFVASA